MYVVILYSINLVNNQLDFDYINIFQSNEKIQSIIQEEKFKLYNKYMKKYEINLDHLDKYFKYDIIIKEIN